MDLSLETQVGQIYINNKKLSKSFISLFSEKIPETNTDIFLLLEVNIPNPAAWAEYEKMISMFASILRRNFRKINENSFENSIAQINESLTQLSAAGQTSWVGKTNACIAAKQEGKLFLSTAGKIHAYLFREKQFSDISEPVTNPNPLKTFENFTVGKLINEDFLIFTTAQLLNYVSVERLKRLISDFPLEIACQSIAQLIKDSAEPNVSFGTFILEIGKAGDFENQNAIKMLHSFEQKGTKERLTGIASLGKKFLAQTRLWTKNVRMPKISLENIDTALLKEHAKKYTDVKRLKELPKAKKFFLVSAAIFLILVIVNIAIASRNRQTKISISDRNNKLAQIQTDINDANTSFIYNDSQKASSLLSNAQKLADSLPNDASIQDSKSKLIQQITDLSNRINHIFAVQTNTVIKYGNGDVDRLVKMGNIIYLVNFSGDLVVPYDLAAKQISSSFTVSAPPIATLAYANNLIYFSDKNGGLFSLDPISKKLVKINLNLPTNAIGLAIYGTPNKAYAIDKTSGLIKTTLLSANAAPSDYIKDSSTINNPLDISVDHYVYVLSNNKIQKYVTGTQKPFIDQGINIQSANAKIFSSPATKYLYVLNPDTKRIMMIDKNKNTLLRQYASDSFTNIKDFIVDETNKVIYVLNDRTVLTMPFATN